MQKGNSNWVKKELNRVTSIYWQTKFLPSKARVFVTLEDKSLLFMSVEQHDSSETANKSYGVIKTIFSF